MSRKEIANLLKLTPAAITLIVNEMIEEGILREVGESQGTRKVGRREVLIDIHYQYKYVIGVSIGSDKVQLSMMNIKGKILDSKTLDTKSHESASEILDSVKKIIDGFLLEHKISRDMILGIGIGVIGIVDRDQGISKKAYGIWEGEVPIRTILEEKLHIPVIVDNNVIALAKGEMFFGFEFETSNVLFVKYGPGIGSTVIIDNKIYRGSKGMSGEIGHTIVLPKGPSCTCGGKGCLEAVASPKVIMDKVIKEFNENTMPILYQLVDGDRNKIDYRQIMAAYTTNDFKIKSILSEAVYYFAIGLFNAMKMYDPDLIILYGEVFEFKDFMDELNLVLSNGCLDKSLKKIIKKSKFNNQLETLGPAAMVVNDFFKNGGVTRMRDYRNMRPL
ncbi:ROK family transcriptional regulator [Tepidibacillus marianensis]|uniref:ROK family transcriptional regulator n=1 Tax=Tepidibacillus marianensis TaxID=3131995 RepID=UPI0030CBBC7B